MYLAACSAQLQYSLQLRGIKSCTMLFLKYDSQQKDDVSVKQNLSGQIVYTKVFGLKQV